MNHIFISYRRDDAGHATGRINDRLRENYGDDAVFIDVDNIPVGVDFRVHLDEQVSKCNVLLAVIGKKWLTIKNKRRLDDSTDFLSIEIESALERNIPIVPLLVQGAKMPSPENLPDSIQALAFRQGIAIRGDPDFHNDMDRLIADVSKHLKQLEGKEQSETKKATEIEHKAEKQRGGSLESERAEADKNLIELSGSDFELPFDPESKTARFEKKFLARRTGVAFVGSLQQPEALKRLTAKTRSPFGLLAGKVSDKKITLLRWGLVQFNGRIVPTEYGFSLVGFFQSPTMLLIYFWVPGLKWIIQRVDQKQRPLIAKEICETLNARMIEIEYERYS